MVPPDQRLHAFDPAGGEVHHRLVVQGQLVLPDRFAHFRDHDALQPARVQQGRLEHLDAAVRLGLGRVHGRIGLHDQVIHGLAGFRDPQADAGAAGDSQVADVEALVERLEDPVRHPARADQIGLRQHDGEFVAAKARHGVRLADGVLQAARDHPQHVVAGAVSQGVVDALERIEVENQQRRRHLAPRGLGQRVAQDRVECRPVGQLGQRVGQRHAFELHLRLTQHGRSAFDPLLELLVDGLQVISHQVDAGNDGGDVVPGPRVRDPGAQIASGDPHNALPRGRAAWGPVRHSSRAYCLSHSTAADSEVKNCAGIVSLLDRRR